METLAGDVAGILDEMGVSGAVIAGHSLGGYVTFAFWRMFAERVKGLGLVCTRATADDAAAAQGRLELARRTEDEGIAAVAESFMPRLLADSTRRERPDVIERTRAVVERTNPLGAAAMLRGMAARVSSEDLLADIDVPVRVVAGLEDVLIPVERSREMTAALPSARLDLLKCGHLPQFEAPDDLTRSLEDLLDEVAARRG